MALDSDGNGEFDGLEDEEDQTPIPVTDPISFACSIGPDDRIGMMVVANPRSGERRVIIEILQTYEDPCEPICELVHESALATKVILTPAGVRRVAGHLLSAADFCDGLESSFMASDISELDNE